MKKRNYRIFSPRLSCAEISSGWEIHAVNYTCLKNQLSWYDLTRNCVFALYCPLSNAQPHWHQTWHLARFLPQQCAHLLTRYHLLLNKTRLFFVVRVKYMQKKAMFNIWNDITFSQCAFIFKCKWGGSFFTIREQNQKSVQELQSNFLEPGNNWSVLRRKCTDIMTHWRELLTKPRCGDSNLFCVMTVCPYICGL